MSDKGVRDKYETAKIINLLIENKPLILKITPQPKDGNDFLVCRKTKKDEMYEAKGSDSRVSAVDVAKSILQQVEVFERERTVIDYFNLYTPKANFDRKPISNSYLILKKDDLIKVISKNWPDRFSKIPDFEKKMVDLLHILSISIDGYFKADSIIEAKKKNRPLLKAKFSLSDYDADRVVEAIESSINQAKYSQGLFFIPDLVGMTVYKKSIYEDFYDFTLYEKNIPLGQRAIRNQIELDSVDFESAWGSLILNNGTKINDDIIEHLRRVIEKNGSY